MDRGESGATLTNERFESSGLSSSRKGWTMAKSNAEAASSQLGGTSIIIDNVPCFAPRRQLSGTDLRNLPNPPIAADRDLWQEVDGDLDRAVNPGDTVDIRPQMRFFSVPRVINPGGRR